LKERPKVLDLWDEVQHDPLTLPPDDFRGLDIEDAVALIRGWFFENFEDPAHSTPYESREGGYQYIWGGPYNTRDIIENVFADTASDELIDAATDSVEKDGIAWVPNSRRLQPPEEDDQPQPELRDAAALHAEMQKRIAMLEETIAKLRPPPEPGIGHNNPPEPLEDEPLSAEDRRELSQALDVLKSQPPQPPDDGEAAGNAAIIVKAKAEKAQSWIARQADSFVSEAVKEAGKGFGRWAPRALFLLLADYLWGLHDIAIQWLQALHLPF
jgi:hypothetical protein